ncbi:hypothetical protein YDYSY3_38420 [Paenibacillus chitinolyticus]|uniref:hypothetical protein n=1 Tax=Paenibacillus chitinolyticus TaxID=79263 RepID=UPI0026E4E66D|nr:hypothetical protein [Paenibacillus chitinolyticus]GKS12842.1 hypothetical protein YDYSY3_38420 [Paenibacillus chitinolyticus]
MRRIALITESSARPIEAKPAYLFYQGKQSRWINAVISYMEAREFPRKDIYFLSFHGQQIIGYEDIVTPYPKQKYHPRSFEAESLAKKTVDLILKMNPLPFVEIHAGRTIADPLKRLFEKHNIMYRIYGDGVPLGTKPSYYEHLIDEENKERKQKGIQREKWKITSLIGNGSPEDASKIVTTFGEAAHLYNIESNIQELKDYLGRYNRKMKEANKARREMEEVMQEEDSTGILNRFISQHQTLAELHAHHDFELIKYQYGKSMAKFILYLIKLNYVQLTSNKIGEALLRTQIALMK